jgi:hypothetical protein
MLAQVRSKITSVKEEKKGWRKTIQSIDRLRLMRFAAKGLVSGLLWSYWYDISDSILLGLERNYLFATFANLSATGRTLAKTAMAIALEQFLWCPAVFGLFDLPVSTVLNGASVRRIPFEIRTKLGEMLKENAKLWTFANILVYNSPLRYRTGLASIFDVWWESILSDFAADCGKDECPIQVEVSSAQTEQALIPVKFPDSGETPAAVFVISNATYTEESL